MYLSSKLQIPCIGFFASDYVFQEIKIQTGSKLPRPSKSHQDLRRNLNGPVSFITSTLFQKPLFISKKIDVEMVIPISEWVGGFGYHRVKQGTAKN
jgi:hypothetical protein